MMPDLDTLADFVEMTEAWEQGGLPLQSLLDDALPLVQRVLPHATALRLYQAADGGELLPLASTDEQLNPRSAIQATAPQFDPDYSAWQVPIPPMLLEVVVSAADDTQDGIETWFALLGRTLGNALERQQTGQIRTIMSRVVKTHRAIASAENAGEMCRIMMDVMPEPITIASIMLFDRPAGGETLPTSLSIEAAATRDQLLTAQVRNEFPQNEPLIRAFVNHLNSGEAFITADSRKLDKPLTAQLLAYFAAMGVYSFVMVGLRTGSRLLGMLTVGAPESLMLNQAQLDIIASVGDQVAEALDMRHLLQSTEAGLQEARTLYNLNRDLLTTESNVDLLRVLRRHLAPSASALAFYTFGWDETNNELTSLVTEALIDQKGEREPQHELLTAMNPEDIAAITTDRLVFGQNIDLLDDLELILDQRPAARLFHQQGVRASIVIPFHEDGRVVQQVQIRFDEPQQFDDGIRRLYSVARDQITIILENRRLLRDAQAAASNLESQVRVLETINHLAGELANTQNEKSLMDHSCEALVNALQVDHASVALLSDDKQSAKIVSEYPSVVSVGAPVELDNILQDELRELKTVVVVDIDGDPRLPEKLREQLKQGSIHSMLFHPLSDPRTGYMGSIGLGIYHREQQITQEMIDITQTIATQMTVTLQKIRLLRSSQYQARQLEGIVGFGQSIQSTFDVRTLLEVSLLNIAQIVPAHHISIFFYDVARGRLKTVAMASESGESQIDVNGVTTVDLTGTTAEKTWTKRDAVNIGDIGEKQVRYACHDDVRSVLSLPIFSRGAAIGVIEVGNHQPAAFSTVDMTVLQQLVSQFAIAVENAEAYTQSQRLAQSKVLVNEISSQLQEQVEVDQLLHVATRELGKALGAKQARVRLDVSSINEAG